MLTNKHFIGLHVEEMPDSRTKVQDKTYQETPIPFLMSISML